MLLASMRLLPKKKGMKCILFVIVLALAVPVAEARPYASGMNNAENVDFERTWNTDLEKKELHPLEGYKRPYWRSMKPKHVKELKAYKRNLIRPLRSEENSVQLNALYLYTNNLDQPLAYRNGATPTTIGSEVSFDTRGLAYEVIGRFPAINYNIFVNYLSYSPRDEVIGAGNAQGYTLTFGNRVSEITGLSSTKLNFYQIGNERFLGKKKESRFSILSGLSFFDFTRFERIRGSDRLGLSNATSTILPGDPIVIEQGEETLDKESLGLFAGLKYSSHLGNNFVMSSRASYHLFRTDQNISFLNQKVSRNSLFEQTQSRNQSTQSDGLIDFEFKIQKYFRHFYNVALGFRYLQIQEESRTSLGRVRKDHFSMKGVQASFQRFF